LNLAGLALLVNRMTLKHAFVRTIHREKLFRKGDTIIVALSGGMDSCALLHLLVNLPELSPKLVVAHVNHKLRGMESDSDEMFVRLLAEKYKIPFEFCRADVAKIAREQGLNLEDAGRRVRKSFLESIRVKYDAKAIALAHHADDQAETVLMRLLRGSGMDGLTGMLFHSGNVIRPLLTLRRCEISSYVNTNKIEYREDSSNKNNVFLRNRIRHELLPILNSYNPQICEQLTTTANIIREDNSLLDNQAESLFSQKLQKYDSEITFPVSWLLHQPLALRRRIIRKAIEKMNGNLFAISYVHIESVNKIISSDKPNSNICLPHGLRAKREYDKLSFNIQLENIQNQLEPLIITKPGNYKLSDGSELQLFGYEDQSDKNNNDQNCATISLEAAPFPWEIRAVQPGDRIEPNGMGGRKKLKDLFIEKKIPLSKRKQIPIIFFGNKAIWVCGLCRSSLASADSDSTHCVKAIYRPVLL
jgi:tRNA(Ile)-lysidine synthase